ncbi:MAG: sugar phosphate isomerase/epimerase [Lentisphaeraceae bacterium]|nr:sugar phosphate isomerase/epimerase [Lentisphaeraceae bacterium]
MNRRQFLIQGSALGLACQLSALEPITRVNPRIKGVSLAAYSLKSELNWFKGKQTDGKMNMLSFLDFAAREQFDAVEPTAYFFPKNVDRTYMNKFKRRAHILGLDISGGAIGNNFGYTPDSTEAKAQLAYTKKWIDLYADLGAPVIRVFAGKRVSKTMSEEQILKNQKHNLLDSLSYADKRGVILGLENHDSMENIDKLLSFVKTIDSPSLGITFDSANIAKTANPYAELTKLAPYTVNAQVKVKIPVNGVHEDADLARIIQILKDSKYAGYIVLEYEEKEDPLTEVPKYKSMLKSFI